MSKCRRGPKPATVGFDDQELATRWSIVAKLRNPRFPWDGGSNKRKRNGSGDVQGLCSYAQALNPVLDMAPSCFLSHASMRDALQAVHKTHEFFGPVSDAQLWVTADTASGCWRLLCKHVNNFAKTRAVIEDGVVKSRVAQIKLPVNAGGDVCAQIAGGELEAAAKTVTVPTSHRSSSHARRFRRRQASGARGRLVDRVRGTHHESEMFVRTVQEVLVVSGTLIIRVLLFETSLGFVGTAANLTCFGERAQPWVLTWSNEKLTTNTSANFFAISGDSFSISQTYC